MNRVYFICFSFTAFKLSEYLTGPMATFPLWITNHQFIRSTRINWVKLTPFFIRQDQTLTNKDILILCCSTNNADLRCSFKASE